MPSARSVTNYALARRATLAALFRGTLPVTDACDAHPYLLRAAKYHGEPTELHCPVCRKVPLVTVTYVYGDELGASSGRAAQTAELPSLAAELSEFTVYVVEVCAGCGWNHLTLSYVLGTGEPVRRRRRAEA